MEIELVTRKEIADYFKVTPKTVQNWTRKGVIEPYCMNGVRPCYELQSVIKTITDKGRGNLCK